MKDIRKIYPSLDIEWRKQPQIIKGLFKERDGFEIDLNYCRSIPNEELAEKFGKSIKKLQIQRIKRNRETLESSILSLYERKSNTKRHERKEIKNLKI